MGPADALIRLVEDAGDMANKELNVVRHIAQAEVFAKGVVVAICKTKGLSVERQTWGVQRDVQAEKKKVIGWRQQTSWTYHWRWATTCPALSPQSRTGLVPEWPDALA